MVRDHSFDELFTRSGRQGPHRRPKTIGQLLRLARHSYLPLTATRRWRDMQADATISSVRFTTPSSQSTGPVLRHGPLRRAFYTCLNCNNSRGPLHRPQWQQKLRGLVNHRSAPCGKGGEGLTLPYRSITPHLSKGLGARSHGRSAGFCTVHGLQSDDLIDWRKYWATRRVSCYCVPCTRRWQLLHTKARCEGFSAPGLV